MWVLQKTWLEKQKGKTNNSISKGNSKTLSSSEKNYTNYFLSQMPAVGWRLACNVMGFLSQGASKFHTRQKFQHYKPNLHRKKNRIIQNGRSRQFGQKKTTAFVIQSHS